MSSATSTDHGLQPWQFFVLAALACATAVTFISRGQGFTSVLLLSLLMAATALVGLAVLRTVRPLVTVQEDRTMMVGERTRAALEREKMLALRALKELEFDRAMRKVSEDDFREMSVRLRARATRIMRQLDAGSSYRGRIEADLAKRLGEKEDGRRADHSGPPKTAARTCSACSTANDADARFCKECGAEL
jgi:pyruvate/2-oxoacid:ferredoxin oxidoreductase beta subunit